MDIRVQELLERIKQDGVNEAKAQADAILQEAEAKKAAIIADAEKQAELIISRAKEEAKHTEAASRTALVQASRDLLNSFKEQVIAIVNKIISLKVKEAYTVDVLKKAIPVVLEQWAKESSANSTIMIPEQEKSAMEAYIKQELADLVKKGLEIKPVKSISAGFRVGEKDGSAYYDCSAEAVAELFGAFVNDKLKSIMDEAVK